VPVGEFNPPERLLLGPGPSQVHPRVLRAMSAPLIGHLDPAFVQMMEEVKDLLRIVFATKNPLTIPISGTGSAGMEACFVNLLEPGDQVIVGVNGVFGTRMAEVAERSGAVVKRVEAPWGKIIRPEQIEAALKNSSKPKLVAVVHAETSTGAWQPLPEIAKLAHDHGALVLADCVTSLGGAPVLIDEWGIDAAYSGTQKCLSCPPGLSPITFGPRAFDVLKARKSKVQSWYLDLSLLAQYWGEERVYHHTAPITMNYALREALRLVVEEGLEARFARHRRNHEALAAGLGAIGLTLAAEEGHRLPMLNAVTAPEGVDEARVRGRLLNEQGSRSAAASVR
jgi:alanine-glyoxylate transaminase/serine-glyoxylate transaminase/serine-pyruvate transaminase